MWDAGKVAVSFSTVASIPGRPLAITNAGDGSGRLFIAEQGGKVYSLKGGTVSGPFLDISSKVSGGPEQGLLGIDFHPDYPADNRVFVFYTNGGGDIVISSFEVPGGTPNAADPGSELVLLTIEHSSHGNHNGGGLSFGPDGYLYAATGDGGGGGDPDENGQDTSSLLGKILRLDVDSPSGGRNYGIPGSNPFVGRNGADEVWLYGLRNPFRFSFDRSNGDLWLGDVGQQKWEEIDVARAGVGGLNYGWDVMEGFHCYEPASGCDTSGKTLPVLEYPNDASTCAVIGGHVYRGSIQTALKGGYVFLDECSGQTWGLDPSRSGQQALVLVGDAAGGMAGFGEDEAGELFVANLGGSIYRVVGKPR